jgi:hypothetical protein
LPSHLPQPVLGQARGLQEPLIPFDEGQTVGYGVGGCELRVETFAFHLFVASIKVSFQSTFLHFIDLM